MPGTVSPFGQRCRDDLYYSLNSPLFQDTPQSERSGEFRELGELESLRFDQHPACLVLQHASHSSVWRSLGFSPIVENGKLPGKGD